MRNHEKVRNHEVFAQNLVRTSEFPKVPLKILCFIRSFFTPLWSSPQKPAGRRRNDRFSRFRPLFNPWAPHDDRFSKFFSCISDYCSRAIIWDVEKKIHDETKKLSKSDRFSSPDTLHVGQCPNARILLGHTVVTVSQGIGAGSKQVRLKFLIWSARL